MSNSKPPKLIEVESPWVFDQGIVRTFLTGNHEGPDDVLLRLYNDDIERPYILENMYERRLHFKRDAVQSVMSIDDPDALVTAYTRKMMSFLLFTPFPKHILMVGLGGGSLAKFCYRHFPRTKITVVEISADVIALREAFCVPKDDTRFRVVHDDGARYVEHMKERADVILVDAFDQDGISPSLVASSFFVRAADRMMTNGVFVMNLSGRAERIPENIRAARAAFRRQIILVPVMGDDNILLFALKRPLPTFVTNELETRAQRLQTTHQLEFGRYLRRIIDGRSSAKV